MIKGIGVAASDHREHSVKIEYDDTEIAKGIITASQSNQYENAGMTLDVPFGEDETVSVYGRDSPAAQNPKHRYWLTFVTGRQPVDSGDD